MTYVIFPSITRITICKTYFSIFLVELDKPFLKLQEWPTRSENIRNALGGSCHLDLRNSHQAKIANFKTLEPILKAPVRGQPRQPSGDGQIPDLPWQVYPAKIREFCQCFNWAVFWTFADWRGKPKWFDLTQHRADSWNYFLKHFDFEWFWVVLNFLSHFLNLWWSWHRTRH